jgi:N-acetylmuramoyl-L-alanine amidase
VAAQRIPGWRRLIVIAMVRRLAEAARMWAGRLRAARIAGALIGAVLACICGVLDSSAAGPAVPGPNAVGPTVALSPRAASSPEHPRTPALPLAGRVVGIDPGHDGGNFSDPSYIDQFVWNGREEETCDTTGTETADGFTEAAFNFDVAEDLRAVLVANGATVVMTRQNNTGVGPCVTTRAQIINNAHAAVAIDIHADGGPSWGRGFTVLEPVADGPNDAVIALSQRFGADVQAALQRYTTMPQSNYDGSDGVISRDDLAGLNLTTVPKVLVECGNMPNPTDAALLASPSFQQQLARALAAAIIVLLDGQ